MKKTGYTKMTRVFNSRVSIILAITLSLVLQNTIVHAEEASSNTIEKNNFYAENFVPYYSDAAKACTTTQNVSTVAAASDGTTSGGAATTLNVKKDFSLGSNDAQRPVELLKYLVKDYNLKPHQAAGIVGNFMEESGGHHLPPDVNEGGAAGPPRFTGGYGWAQWTGGRQTAFIDFAVNNGYIERGQRATDAANYAYLNKELSVGSEARALPAIRAAVDPEDAAIIWQDVFERPNADLARSGERSKSARKVFNAYNSGEGVDSASSGSSTIDASDGLDGNPCGGSNGDVAGGNSQQLKTAFFDKATFPLEGGASSVAESSKSLFQNGTTGQSEHPYIAYDILAPAGTKVIALTDGVVSNTSSSSLAQSVTVHTKVNGKDVAIYYAHMNTDKYARKGETVKAGDFIGTVASVSRYPGINADHLHIDASYGVYRVPCSRSSCSASNKAKFIDIGPDLFKLYEASKGETIDV